MAADTPTLTTDNPTEVEEYSVTFHGQINSCGADLSCDAIAFTHGTGSVSDPGSQLPYNFGYTHSWWEAGTYSPGDYSHDSMGGHSPGTRYYTRFFAHNSFGWAWGEEIQYLTKPLAPSGFSVVSGGVTQLNLSWTKGSGAGRTEIRRKIGSTPSSRSDGDLVYLDTGTSYSDTGLTTGTHYYYRAWSEKTVDALTQYSDNSVADSGAPGVVLPTVNTLAATNITDTNARLNGEIVDTGGENCNQRGFQWQIFNSGLDWNSVSWNGSFGIGTFNYYAGSAMALTRGTKYQFRAFAHNAAGTRYGSTLYFLTRPYQTTNLSAILSGDTQIDLTWTRHVSANRTLIIRKAGSAPADMNDGTQVYFGTGTSYSDTGLVNNTTYYYRAWSEKSVDDLQQYASTAPTANATTSSQAEQQVNTAAGTGTAGFLVDTGTISSLTALNVADSPCRTAPRGASFTHGLFSFNINTANPGDTIVITITMPSAIPTNTQYWKCINGQWVNVTSLIGDNDGDNVLTLTITDGGLGDADGIANGIIVDPGGPGIISLSAPSSPSVSQSSSTPERYETNPARISIKYLNVQPQQAQLGQPVIIYANIANSGDETGKYTASLKINGELEETRTGHVSAHAAVPLKFEVVKDQPGTYTVDINGQQSHFTIIDSQASPAIGRYIPIIGFFICMIGVIVASFTLIIRRRKGY